MKVYRDLFPISDAFTNTAIASSINVFISTLKIFKYLQLNESLMLLVRVLPSYCTRYYTLYTPLLPYMHLCAPIIHVYIHIHV